MDMDIKEMEAIVEGLLFAAGDPVPLVKIAEILELDKATAKRLLDNMSIRIQNSLRGILMREVDGSYQLCTRPEHFEYISRLAEPRQKQTLSQAAFETLAIIAYNQPVTRARIEAIRGVNSDSSIATLLERGLIKEAGRLDSPGRPLLYETTGEFLRSFGFRSVKDLPMLELDKMVSDESNSTETDGNALNSEQTHSRMK
ncbi:MAG: SMC-Scp complex subunit ScpB [Clostridiaceae bacterium]|nr:SMC-Scp complex subunit ScpB [Clostridiaceae bacterium]